MREIIFRGRTETGLWIEGDLWQYPTGTKAIRCDALGHTVPVDPETVGQYTGLEDKNGIRIFEGDIISAVLVDGIHKGFRWPNKQVAFHDGSFVLYDGKHENIPLGSFAPSVQLEVIGNIHHYDPELMGGATCMSMKEG
jgi:uncharacterized phage protein (TIGR01671 family)